MSVIGVISSSLNAISNTLEMYDKIKEKIDRITPLLNATDNYINQSSRLALMNDGLQTQSQLQDKIYQSAQRSRSSYDELVNSVAELGLRNASTFKNNDETIAFAELMSKSFKISGASISQSSDYMNQLTQAMADGSIQGSEFESMMGNAPMLAQAVGKYTGKSIGDLQDMASKGELSSNIIKNSLFNAADEINGKFSTMPMTFGDIWTRIGNYAIINFSTIMQKINNFLNSDVGASIIDKITNSISYLANGIGFIIDMVMMATTVINDSIEIIKMAFIGLCVIAIAKAIQVAGTWIAANIAYATIAIQCAFLTAQKWIVTHLPLLAIIATIIVLIGILMRLGVTTDQVVGVIGGIFASLGAVIFNVVAFIWNSFASIAEFLVNVFNHPLYSIKKLFADIWNGIIDLVVQAVDGIIDIINLIPGIDIKTGALSKLFKIDPGKPPEDHWEAPKMAMKDLGDSFKFGYSKGSNLANGFKMPELLKMPELPKVPDMTSWNKAQDPGQLPLGGLDDGSQKHLENISDKIDVSNEHLEMLRDLAEAESIQNFVSLTPTVQVTTGDVKEEADINKIIAKIETYMETELANSAEGVYA